MTEDAGPRPPAGGGIPAVLVRAPDTDSEQSVPVYDHIFVGRECAGVDASRRLIVDDEKVSRIHLDIRLDHENDRAWLTDRSTNGTSLNGTRIERYAPVQIGPGDRVQFAGVEVQFRSRRFLAVAMENRSETVREVRVTNMTMVVGDILAFSTISEYTDDRVLLENIDRLYVELRVLLARHGGTLRNYIGDAIFATWDADTADARAAAVAFAVDAAQRVPEFAPQLQLRDPENRPLRMGWGVAFGPAAVSSMTGMLVSVLSDTTNVAFRLSALAGREGMVDVLVTDSVHRGTADRFRYTPPTSVRVKGRNQAVGVRGSRADDHRSRTDRRRAARLRHRRRAGPRRLGRRAGRARPSARRARLRLRREGWSWTVCAPPAAGCVVVPTTGQGLGDGRHGGSLGLRESGEPVGGEPAGQREEAGADLPASGWPAP